jgi:hypothetical protein
MKKRQLIVVTLIGLGSLGLVGFISSRNLNDGTECLSQENTSQLNKDEEPVPGFNFGIGNRFTGVSRNLILSATSLKDFLPKEDADRLLEVKSFELIIVQQDRQTRVRQTSFSDQLTDIQKSILVTASYSTSFHIRH